MDFNEFIQNLVNVVEDKIEDDTHVIVNSVVKNNGIHLSGLCFKNDSFCASPTIYVDYYYTKYNEGMAVEDIANEVIKVYEHNRLANDFNMDFFVNYDEVRDKLFCKIVNMDKNEEMLSYTPFRQYLDLAIVVYCKVDNADIGMASVIIRNNHLNMWEKSADEVIDTALYNTRNKMKYSISHIIDTLEDVSPGECNFEENDLKVPMYVISSENKIFGAIYMVYQDVLKEIYNIMGGEYLILPSSVHEFITIKYDTDTDVQNINAMIQEINKSSLKEEDVLSDHAYRYSDNDQVLIF